MDYLMRLHLWQSPNNLVDPIINVYVNGKKFVENYTIPKEHTSYETLHALTFEATGLPRVRDSILTPQEEKINSHCRFRIELVNNAEVTLGFIYYVDKADGIDYRYWERSTREFELYTEDYNLFKHDVDLLGWVYTQENKDIHPYDIVVNGNERPEWGEYGWDWITIDSINSYIELEQPLIYTSGCNRCMEDAYCSPHDGHHH